MRIPLSILAGLVISLLVLCQPTLGLADPLLNANTLTENSGQAFAAVTPSSTSTPTPTLTPTGTATRPLPPLVYFLSYTGDMEVRANWSDAACSFVRMLPSSLKTLTTTMALELITLTFSFKI